MCMGAKTGTVENNNKAEVLSMGQLAFWLNDQGYQERNMGTDAATLRIRPRLCFAPFAFGHPSDASSYFRPDGDLTMCRPGYEFCGPLNNSKKTDEDITGARNLLYEKKKRCA